MKCWGEEKIPLYMTCSNAKCYAFIVRLGEINSRNLSKTHETPYTQSYSVQHYL